MRRAEDRGRLDAIRDRLRSGGRRWTVAKGAVIEALLAEGGHLSAQQIHQSVAARYPQIDRSTVHRVVLVLADEHVVHALGQHGEARYGLADRPHHHVLCAGCGDVAEVPGDVVEPLLAAANAATGYRFDGHGLTLTGRCTRCA